MLQKLRSNQKGFTLIELMIVIAIIGILAAIAVPQFMAYRMRGYHSVTVSDLRNWVAAQSALKEDGATYGISEFVSTLNPPAGSGPAGPQAGNLVVGGRTLPESRMATAGLGGCKVTGSRNDSLGNGIAFGFPVSVADGVKLRSDVSVSPAAPLFQDSYIMFAEHQKGIRVFAADSDVTNTIFFGSDEAWPNNAASANTLQCNNAIVPLAGLDDFTGIATGGAKVITWQVMK